MKILFAGKYDPDYNRTKVLIDGLKCFPEVEVSFYAYTNRLQFRPWAFRRLAKRADIIFLPSFTHQDVPMIRSCTPKPILFDPLISRYLSKVFDYRKVGKYSPRALKNFLKDKLSMTMADMVLCDTQAHQHYFQSVIGIPAHKLRILPVGVNTDEFQPDNTKPTKPAAPFLVGFYGTFIPLHGTRAIIEAARVLEGNTDIQFQLIGAGFEYEAIKKLALMDYRLTNIHFPGWLNYEELSRHITSFDIALGIFGKTLKTDLVIPNKIFHYAAMQKAIITKSTPAIREIFTENVDIILSSVDPEDIAKRIMLLKTNHALRESVAQQGFVKITRGYNHQEIARRLLTFATELLEAKKKY